MPESVTLPLYCVYCGGPVTLIYAPDPRRRTVGWTCPYTASCGRFQLLDLEGSVVAVAVRSEPRT